MKNFEYLQPTTLDNASKINAKKGDVSQFFAGGTDLLGTLKDDLFFPDYLINLKSINNIDKIEQNTNELKIGSLVKVNSLIENKFIKDNLRALYDAAMSIATPQLRNIGTVGGNICQRPRCHYFRNNDFPCLRKDGEICFAYNGHNKYHAIIGGGPCYIVHPSDLASALISLDAKVTIYNSKYGVKKIELSEFFILPEEDVLKENILELGDIITEISIPLSNLNSISKYIKIKERGSWDFALSGISGSFKIKNNKIFDGKVVFSGIAPIPWQDNNLNNELSKGVLLSDSNIENISENILEEAEPLKMNNFKIRLAKNLVKQLLIEIRES